MRGSLDVRATLLISAVAVGLALVVVPLLPTYTAMEMPEEFPEDSIPHKRLMEAAFAIDRASTGGDLPALKQRITERYMEKLGRGATGGRRVEDLLKEERHPLVGDLHKQQFVCGGARGDRAVMIYASERRVGSGRREELLRVFEFQWDGEKFRLDGKRTHLPQDWSVGDLQPAALQYREQLLAAPPR